MPIEYPPPMPSTNQWRSNTPVPGHSVLLNTNYESIFRPEHQGLSLSLNLSLGWLPLTPLSRPDRPPPKRHPPLDKLSAYVKPPSPLQLPPPFRLNIQTEAYGSFTSTAGVLASPTTANPGLLLFGASFLRHGVTSWPSYARGFGVLNFGGHKEAPTREYSTCHN